ncbi:yippee-domain-containing protein [Xylaria nigripes]|nr:yippee-domain-containing protein [Xylaria nigripes]
MLSLVPSEVASPPLNAQAASAGATDPALKFPKFLLPTFARPFRLLRHLSRPSSSSGNANPVHGDNPSLNNSQSGLLGSGSADSSSASSSPPPNNTEQHFDDVPRLAKVQPDTIRCSTCGADIAFYSQVVSKGFTGRYGRAYLVSPPDIPLKKGEDEAELMNIKVGRPESRTLVTGAHTVSDIQCAICRARIGWKYVDAKEESQKYKIGKFILETRRTIDYRNWEDVTTAEMLRLEREQTDLFDARDSGSVVFDSGDEEECEDLFAGIWNAAAAKRRRSKYSKKR